MEWCCGDGIALGVELAQVCLLSIQRTRTRFACEPASGCRGFYGCVSAPTNSQRAELAPTRGVKGLCKSGRVPRAETLAPTSSTITVPVAVRRPSARGW